MKTIYGPLNILGKKLSIPLSVLVSNRFTCHLFSVIKIYLSILLGQGAGTGWDLESEIKAAVKIIKISGELSEDITIFDIGANKGEWSNLMASKYPKAFYYLFEPQPGCQTFIENKQIPNMKLIPYAVSASQSNTIKMFSVSETAGLASLYQRRDSYFQSEKFFEIDVSTTTIDTIINQFRIDRVHFMKMDIEGHELEALKGASNSLENGLIQALSFEFGSGNINSKTYFHDFWDLLSPKGYHIYRILPWGGLLPISEYYEDLEYFRGSTNYIAALNELS